ncbi:hypothetical protein GCM10007108_00780 [Thermogymnomonas acidicola]|uniref:Uncharacterized protein n=1 Tax=Thermogymnomonas acidicola TaxID=399579 RepID=A0AA37BPV6_9ARCH|nr:hypothetical protein [Thermogymnomonas acidicola]GGM66428.1 hypothetical protein GCM10007108_00780 [Thermogymnomonas acidicola]
MAQQFKPWEKWKRYQVRIPSDKVQANRALRSFMKIRTAVFLVNLVATATVIGFILARVI